MEPDESISAELNHCYDTFGVGGESVVCHPRSGEISASDLASLATRQPDCRVNPVLLEKAWKELTWLLPGVDLPFGEALPVACLRGLYAQTAWYYGFCMGQPRHEVGNIDRISEWMCAYARSACAGSDPFFGMLTREMLASLTNRIRLTLKWHAGGLCPSYEWEGHARTLGAISDDTMRLIDWIASDDSAGARYACVACAEALLAAGNATDDDPWEGALPAAVSEFELHGWPPNRIQYLCEKLNPDTLHTRVDQALLDGSLEFAWPRIGSVRNALADLPKASLDRSIARVVRDLEMDLKVLGLPEFLDSFPDGARGDAFSCD
ncbi:MAG: hypothetical protein KF858_01450 [Candidatus Sumerlaeia bacterium]|nr:hypothetical protein [Candidatus Sumerlaeia bacterium]